MLFLLTFCFLLIDLITKFFAKTYLIVESNKFFIFRLKYILNKGLAGSFFSNFGLSHQYFLIILNSSVLILFIFQAYKRWKNKLNIFPESLVIAGGLGNIISRIIYGGVVDFFEVIFFEGNSSILNIADIYISLGIGLILFRTTRIMIYESA